MSEEKVESLHVTPTLLMETHIHCALLFCVKLVDIASRKILIDKIGIINLMVILVIFLSLSLFVQEYM